MCSLMSVYSSLQVRIAYQILIEYGTNRHKYLIFNILLSTKPTE